MKLEIEVFTERTQASDEEVMRSEREARYQSRNADLSGACRTTWYFENFGDIRSQSALHSVRR